MTFYETIDSLIDVEGVPAGKRCGEGYEAARKEIHDNLATIEDLTAVCYHEAGHLIYARLVGSKYNVSTADFRIVGPQIKYHEATDANPPRYESTSTAIRTPGLRVKIPRTNDGLLDTALVAVAGGESVRDFSTKKNKPMWKLGNADDKDQFKRLADGIRNCNDTIKPYIDHWRDATAKVQEDFESDRYVSEIEGEAWYAMLSVFSSVFSNTKDSQ
jgi:hypothetical protein